MLVEGHKYVVYMFMKSCKIVMFAYQLLIVISREHIPRRCPKSLDFGKDALIQQGSIPSAMQHVDTLNKIDIF